MLRTQVTLRGVKLVLVASIAASLLTVQDGSAREPRRGAPSCRLRVHAVEGDGSALHRASGARRGRPRFSAYETSALELDLLCLGDPPIADSVRVDLHLPNGELFRTLTMEPIEARAHSSKRKGWQLRGAVRFPVRGTFVTQNGLFGEWSATLCREVGSRVTCDTGIAFDLDKE